MKITYKMKLGINKYEVGSIVSNEISILLSFLYADVTVQSIAFIWIVYLVKAWCFCIMG